jgi:hypothetical protein
VSSTKCSAPIKSFQSAQIEYPTLCEGIGVVCVLGYYFVAIKVRQLLRALSWAVLT